MREDSRHNVNRVGRLAGYLATEKKKTVLAVCLLALMAFMWIKVFTGRNPEAATADQMAARAGNNSLTDGETNVSYIDLPQVEGRNDVIKKDFFASDGWKDFVDSDKNIVITKEVNVVPGDSNEKVIGRIADNLKLEAFVMGENPRAYINDRILAVGDTLLVSDGVQNYECEVIKIENNSVVMRCEKAEVTLKLKQVIEGSRQF
ncbi:MAG: hypothetical protein P8016_12425 [Sedimentisphaerales bacterium]